MTDHDPALIEKAARAARQEGYYATHTDRWGNEQWQANLWDAVARVVLDAVADDLRREGAEDGWQAGFREGKDEAETRDLSFDGLTARAEQAEDQRLAMERDRNHATCRAEQAEQDAAEWEAVAANRKAALSRVLADVEALSAALKAEDPMHEWGSHDKYAAARRIDALLATHRKAPMASEDRSGGPRGSNVGPSATKHREGQ